MHLHVPRAKKTGCPVIDGLRAICEHVGDFRAYSAAKEEKVSSRLSAMNQITTRRPGRVPSASTTDRHFVQGVQRAFAVLKTFSDEMPQQTIAAVAARTGLARAVARRYLLTLTELEYIAQEGPYFSLTPRVLELGFAYLSTMSVATIGRPHMEKVASTLRESCSMSVLDGRDIVYIARVAAKRLISSTLAVGSRLPAHCTSMGKILLAAMTADELDAFFAAGPLRRMTERTICTESRLRDAIHEVRARGWALNDGESEEGIRSVSAPIIDRSGHVRAAINVAGLASRVSMKDLRGKHLPELLRAADDISKALGADARRLQHRSLSQSSRIAAARAVDVA
jgi:IclR family pca regulon transcriptional regulator